MNLFKKSLLVYLCVGFSSAFSLSAKVDPLPLHAFIKNVSDALYSEAEMNGGGKDGENYRIIIDRNTKEFTSLVEKERSFINNKNQEGLTPLMLAAYYNLFEMVEILMRQDADPSLTCNKGLTAGDYATLGASYGLPGSIKYITRYIMNDYFTHYRLSTCLSLLEKPSRN